MRESSMRTKSRSSFPSLLNLDERDVFRSGCHAVIADISRTSNLHGSVNAPASCQPMHAVSLCTVFTPLCSAINLTKPALTPCHIYNQTHTAPTSVPLPQPLLLLSALILPTMVNNRGKALFSFMLTLVLISQSFANSESIEGEFADRKNYYSPDPHSGSPPRRT